MNNMILIDGLSKVLSSFYLCNHEITEKEFYEIMNGDYPDEAPSNKPIVNVSVFDALIYCNLRSRKENLQPYYNINGTKVTVNKTSTGQRLPTADEWIFACKDLIDFQNINEYAWFHERYVEKEIHEVCQKKATELGLYDMYGNVWEWSFDPKNNSFDDHGGCFKNKAKNIKSLVDTKQQEYIQKIALSGSELLEIFRHKIKKHQERKQYS